MHPLATIARLAAIVLWAVTLPAQEPTPFTWENPLPFSYPLADGTVGRNVSEVRDPAIIRDGDTWYLTYTVWPFTHSDARTADKPDQNSSPGIRLYASQDLKTWTFVDWLVKSSALPDDCPYKHRFWAPEIHKLNGRFYLIFTADNWLKDEYNKGGRIGHYVAFVGVADRVTGPYRNITWLKGAGCDTTLFGDDGGRTYAIMPFGDGFLQEVDLSGIDRGDIRLVGERTAIVRRDNADVGRRSSPKYMEGPWMIKRGGKYVLFTAAPYDSAAVRKKDPAFVPDLADGYWVGTAVADRIQGPYVKTPQVFLGGHIAVFAGPDGREWLSYRGEAGGKPQGRVCIDPIPWNDDGSVPAFKPSTGVMTVR